MKPYLIALAVGILVGSIYSLLSVKSPAPPIVALVGLLGILIGEQVVPIARQVVAGRPLIASIRSACAEPMLGRLPGDRSAKQPRRDDA
jgi:XapX domain-containing protein